MKYLFLSLLLVGCVDRPQVKEYGNLTCSIGYINSILDLRERGVKIPPKIVVDMIGENGEKAKVRCQEVLAEILGD